MRNQQFPHANTAAYTRQWNCTTPYGIESRAEHPPTNIYSRRTTRQTLFVVNHTKLHTVKKFATAKRILHRLCSEYWNAKYWMVFLSENHEVTMWLLHIQTSNKKKVIRTSTVSNPFMKWLLFPWSNRFSKVSFAMISSRLDNTSSRSYTSWKIEPLGRWCIS